ncbi:isoprenylcysteine carboxylmethyltransferase family protein [Roseovarius sp. S4756]|uniref:isoprenylcysteine carboxylmethyltransferase family protein n=1 Tax=Roseovarius maritimus TaxID=3342637 RepID=UPI0037290E66
MSHQTSVASSVTAVIGLTCLGAAIAWQVAYPAASSISAALMLIFSFLIPVALYEIGIRHIHRQPSTGLDWSAPGRRDPRRVGLKLLGLFILLAALVVIHSLFRIYPVWRLVDPLVAIVILAPAALPVTLVYFIEVDRRMVEPHDGYWQLGAWVTGQNPSPDWAYLRNFMLGWAIKGFFLPVMFNYLAMNIPGLSGGIAGAFAGPVDAAAYLTKVMIVMELVIVVVGYTMTMRLFDAHIRSANALPVAWIVTLVCYEPINQIVTGRVFDYRPDRSWIDVIHNHPMLFWPWLGLILLSFFVWLWATAIFGLRWSNLTNRGIITNGPYKYTKHPDYTSKCLFFVLTAAPFMTALTKWEAITASAALTVVIGIYFGRGRMEEKHLSDDPAYVAYALEMNQRSIFRHVAARLPFLIYVAPDGRTGLEPDTAPGGAAVPAE